MDKPKRVLVTGASGFIGSNLIEELVERNFFVNALIDKDLGNLEDIYQKNKEKITIIKGDILDKERIEEALKGVKIVFHLAGISSVSEFVSNPEYSFNVNVKGTQNLLETSQDKGLEKIILISSSLVYVGNLQKINEEGEVEIKSPYAESRREAELIALKEYSENNLPVLIVRLFNVYGKKQSVKAVIPKLICQAIKNEEIYVNCSAEKDFTYIDDAVDALIKLSEIKENGEIINLGSGKSTSLYEISKILKREFGENLNLKYINQEEPKEIFLCDNSKLKRVIDWSAKVDIQTGIKKTIEYIQNHKEQYD